MTNVVRGAGRARHAANRKHQQRTPLPPKGLTDLMPGAADSSPAVKPKPRKRPTRTEIIQEAVAEQVAANAVEKPAKVSKAQALALAAEGAGWEVERIVTGSHKTLRATRGEEVLEANWDNDRSCTPLGFHEVAGRRSTFKHVTVATKILETDPDVAMANAAVAASAKKAPRAVTQRSLATAINFNVATATDEEVLAALAGREITWRNELSNGELTMTGVVPMFGQQTKIVTRDEDDPTTRQLTFADAAGGGYSTLRLSSLTGIGALLDDKGHLLIETRSRAADAMREGYNSGKKSKAS